VFKRPHAAIDRPLDLRFSRRAAGLAVAAAVAAAFTLAPPAARGADTDVRASSIGYVTGRAKHASVTGGGTAFVIRRAADDSQAFQGTLGGAVTDETGDTTRRADFSALDETGSFYVDVAGVGRSIPFSIAGDAYRAPFFTVMLGFYGSRCGTAVSFDYNGTTFGHGACHAGDGLLDYEDPTQAGVTRAGTHGWHDAGDYGKYTVNGAFAAGMMLSAWERHPGGLTDLALPIPERGGALPDFLDELKWQLDWLLTMQYSDTDGRVAHKLTRLAFEDFIMPEADDGLRYFVPYGTAATADYVAALAQAARVYQPYDATFAARCLAAAQRSYAYLVANPANVATSEAAFTTGGYPTTDADDRLWAAAEVWETTGDAAARADLETRINTFMATATRPLVDADFDWGNTKNLGLYTYLVSRRADRDPATVARLQPLVLAAADAVVAAHDASGYGRGVGRYYWGSNGSVARTSMLLDVASRLSGNAGYLDVAIDQIAYLFGRNHYDRSQVTGLGINPPLFPHHRPSASDGIAAPFPGLVVGGGTTATNWVDDQDMFMVNEVAINWSAPLVYALSMFLPAGVWPTTGGGDGGTDAPAAVDAGGAATGSGGGAGADAGSQPVDGGVAHKSGCACTVEPRGGGAGSGGLALGGLALAVAAAARARRRRRR
jgi:endoglucanase